MEGKTVRAKFHCSSVSDDKKSVYLTAVINGSPENEKFFELTPSGTLSLSVLNPEAQVFEEGKQYFVDITAAE